jgi:hypothetical protein
MYQPTVNSRVLYVERSDCLLNKTDCWLVYSSGKNVGFVTFPVVDLVQGSQLFYLLHELLIMGLRGADFVMLKIS